jgi:hypothetical protein
MKIARAWRCPAVAAVAVLTWATAASALVIEIDSCQTLSVPGAAYRLTDDIFACGDCLIVGADRISIDLQEFFIVQEEGCFGGAAVTDGGIKRDVVVVRNGLTFSDDLGAFDRSIDLRASVRTEVRTFIAPLNLRDGIAVGDRALVKNTLALANGGSGITGGDSVQVQESFSFAGGWAGEEGDAGIRVGDRCLVTLNDSSLNDVDGIVAGANCTVTRNFADLNLNGIVVQGPGGHVSSNTADDNFYVGMQVQCPGAVTNNIARGNGDNYVLVGPADCFFNNNIDG